MNLKLYNTFTRKKEIFEPIKKGEVGFYMCGPTVYDYIHIGNARAFLVFDVMRRFLRYLGYDVMYIQNLTDIDDQIIERAKREGVSVEEITEKFGQAFFEDIDALGIERADVHPKATEHIKDIISLIQNLIEKGFAYQVNGDVFYDIAKFPDYGRLSGKNVDELRAGARVAVDERKRNPLDFALWKSYKPGEPAWESPWGKGRPGWHIECSAMSMKYLGNSFDIHAGGEDLIFPHHENEIAQSEAASKRKFAKYWLHNGFLQIDGEKMAKSLGNFKTVRDVLKVFPRSVLRLFFLQKHYRGPIDLTDQGLRSAEKASSRLKIFYENLNKVVTGSRYADQEFDLNALSGKERDFFERLGQMKEKLIAAMSDDLNTPVALSNLFDMVKGVNKLMSKDRINANELQFLSEAKKMIDDFNSFLGVIDVKEEEMDSEVVNDLIALLIELREDLREKKEWPLADKIRNRLSEKGIVLEDKGDATNWRRK